MAKSLYTDKKLKSVEKREVLSDRFTSGKIQDAGEIAPGGRLESYWKKKPVILNKYTTNVPQNLLHIYTDPEATCKYFGLHSIEFGNWLNNNDRVEFLVGIADCLHLIKRLFNISDPTKIGKNELSISLGARGRGSALAHYEPMGKVINITKPHVTSGSFMHEFAHHVDFSLRTKEYGLPSGGNSRDVKIYNERLKAPMPYVWFEKTFEKLYIYNNKPTPFAEQMKKASNYLASRVEVWARTSEVYFRWKALKSKNKLYTKSSLKYKHGANVKYPTESFVEKANLEITNIYDMYFSKRK